MVARVHTKAWDQYQENADYDRDAIYLYLEPVFTVVRKWKKEGLADKYSLIALKQGDIPGRVKADPYSRLLYCSSRNDDPKKRSKWAHCMQWVENHIKTGESFTQFVKRHGGINSRGFGKVRPITLLAYVSLRNTLPSASLGSA